MSPSNEMLIVEEIEEIIGYDISPILFSSHIYVWILLPFAHEELIEQKVHTLQEAELLTVFSNRKQMGSNQYIQIKSTAKLQKLAQSII